MSDKLPIQLEHKEIIKCVQKGKYLGNQKCHVNCLSYAHNHQDKVKSIIGVAQVFRDNTTVAHFILRMVNETYFDPTYGNMSGILDSHLIHIEEYKVADFNPNRELQNLKNYLFSLRPWYYRLLVSNKY